MPDVCKQNRLDRFQADIFCIFNTTFFKETQQFILGMPARAVSIEKKTAKHMLWSVSASIWQEATGDHYSAQVDQWLFVLNLCAEWVGDSLITRNAFE